MDKNLQQVLAKVKKLEAIHECHNLMGRFVFFGDAFRNRDILTLWSKSEEIEAEMPWGVYRGQKGLADLAEDLGDRRDPEFFKKLAGMLRIKDLDTEVLEVSPDGKHARGVWTSLGMDADVIHNQPVGQWDFGRFDTEFILEDGAWKILKLHLIPLWKFNFYSSWTKTEQPKSAEYKPNRAGPKAAEEWSYSPNGIPPAANPEPPLPSEVDVTDEEVSEEELRRRLDRIEAVRECRNLMASYSILHTAYRNVEFCRLWANRDDDLLLMPWGGYRGIEGVRKCYLEDHGDRDAEDADQNPQMHGGLFMHCMDTDIIEVAEDGQTAQGVWFDPGHETYVLFGNGDYVVPDDWTTGTPNPIWCVGKYNVRFIKEDGVWKMWQLQLYPFYRDSVYTSWVHCKPLFMNAFSLGTELPEPIWNYSPEAVYPENRPAPPEPYKTFDPEKHGLMAQYK